MSELIERIAHAIYREQRHWHGLEDNWHTLVSGGKDVSMAQAAAAIAAVPPAGFVERLRKLADCCTGWSEYYEYDMSVIGEAADLLEGKDPEPST